MKKWIVMTNRHWQSVDRQTSDGNNGSHTVLLLNVDNDSTEQIEALVRTLRRQHGTKNIYTTYI